MAPTAAHGASSDGSPSREHRRRETYCWGPDCLNTADQQLVDEDSILLLRQMVLTHLAHLGRARRKLPAPWNFLEHPVDPKDSSTAPSAWRCSSIWATRAVRTWYRLLGNTLITFDQCRLGQVVKKTTTLSTNLQLEEHRQRNTLMSSDLSSYPWRMMQGLANAIYD